MHVVTGGSIPAKQFAKLIGALETAVYPANVRTGWRDFYDDFVEHGDEHSIAVVDGKPEKAVAYLVAFADSGTNEMYVSDIARHPELRGDDHARAMLLLLTRAVELFKGKEFYAELRMPSRGLLHTFCDVHEENELLDYYADGESALSVRATLRPDLLENAVEEYVKARAAKTRRANRRNGLKRANATYSGQSKRGKRGHSVPLGEFAEAFYATMDELLGEDNVIELIPAIHVHDSRDFFDQSLAAADVCTRQILPIGLDMFTWGGELAAKLRNLPPIVSASDAERASFVLVGGHLDNIQAVGAASTLGEDAAADMLRHLRAAWHQVGDLAENLTAVAPEASAKCVYSALMVCALAGDEAAYDRIIDLTNKMLESL